MSSTLTNGIRRSISTVAFNSTPSFPSNGLDETYVTVELPSNGKQFGENRSIEYSDDAITDKILALFNRMVRDVLPEDVNHLYDAVLSDIKLTPQFAESKCTNLIVLCFMTRSCRGGKGEKKLFYQFFELLSNTFTETTKILCKLISHFGYWKDYFQIIARGNISRDMANTILDIVAKQLETDIVSGQSVSLAAKWVPREGKALYKEVTESLKTLGNASSLASQIMRRISSAALQKYTGGTVPQYRKMLADLTAKIDIVETHMCAKQWKEIQFNKVPSVALDRYKHAFALEPPTKLSNGKKIKNVVPYEDRLKKVDLEDREECKQNYIQYLSTNKVKGSQIALEKLVANLRKKLSNSSCVGSIEQLIANSQLELVLAHRQFESYVDSVFQQLKKAEAEVKETNSNFQFSIGNTKCMIDVSGSMEGTPMNAAIGIGILFLNLQKKYDVNASMSFLTFDTNPKIVNLNRCQTFPEMVNVTQTAPWGGSTDFIKAFDEIMIESGRNIKNAPKQLLVLSDMQFNASINLQYTDYNSRVSRQVQVNPWDTMYETICKKWKAHFSCTDKDLPTIVFWNLRGDTSGSPVNSDTKGVIQISGYSASLVKMLLFGEELAQNSAEDEKPNPADVLNRTLVAKEYDVVRNELGWKDSSLPSNSTFALEVAQFLGQVKTISVDMEKLVKTINVHTSNSTFEDVD